MQNNTTVLELFNSGKQLQYFSKWRNEWIDFAPSYGELLGLEKYHYQIRLINHPAHHAAIKRKGL